MKSIMFIRLRRLLLYGICTIVGVTVVLALVVMKEDIQKSLQRKAELVVKTHKNLKEKIDPELVKAAKEESKSSSPKPKQDNQAPVIEEEEKDFPEGKFIEEGEEVEEKGKKTHLPTSPLPPVLERIHPKFANKVENKVESKRTLTSENEQKTDGKKTNITSGKVTEKSKKNSTSTVKPAVKSTKPDTSVHIFYYPWYGTPASDGAYYHWNHPYLPHWNREEAQKWPSGNHVPPDDIGSSFYPKLGCYSSRDISVIHQHMKWIERTGSGVVVVSWYPKGMADDAGKPWDDIMPKILDSAHEFKLKVAFHIEPYKNRSINNLKENIEYIMTNYSKHPAFFYYQHMGRSLPLFYIYDSYLIHDQDWNSLLNSKGVLSLRGTKLDAFYIGLVVEEKHKTSLLKAGFDGFYTYFAADRFTYASTQDNWPNLRAFAKKNKMIFIPSAGPGYLDVRVRPWNKVNTRARHNGTYYKKALETALNSQADLRTISITSFNEWHEGTQIEPAIAKDSADGFRYVDYSPMSPEYYLELTREFVTGKWAERAGKEVEKSINVAAAVIQ